MIVKLSSSGKAVQVITDDGSVFQTSKLFFEGLFSGKSSSGFIPMTRLPWKVSKDRFKPSPVWNPETGEKEVYEETGGDVESMSSDSLSSKTVGANRKKKAFEDKKVW